MGREYLQDLRKKAEAVKARKSNFASQNKYKWTPPEGDSKVRILPYPHQVNDNPFIQTAFHYNIGKHRAILCPQKTFGEPCALCDLAFKNYMKKAYDEKNSDFLMYKELYKAVKPKPRFFSPVVVRGSEDEGPKFWGYPPKVYNEDIEPTYLDEAQYDDCLDEMQGRDLLLKVTKPAGGANTSQYNSTAVKPAGKSSPILTDTTKIPELIESIPDIFSVYLEKRTSEEVQAIVDELLDDNGIIHLDNNGETEMNKTSNTTSTESTRPASKVFDAAATGAELDDVFGS